jgi:hypothetical protein
MYWDRAGGHWSASALVRNIENRAVIMVYPPRTYGLSVRYHFL